MIRVNQTEENITIILKADGVTIEKTQIILLSNYIKVNNPAIMFEGHFVGEIDDVNSSCQILKHESRITLKKVEKNIWPEIFHKLSNQELFQKRKGLLDDAYEKNKLNNKTEEKYQRKSRAEIDKEVRRETATRDQVKERQKQDCNEVVKCETKDRPMTVSHPCMSSRKRSDINMSFSKSTSLGPKRESQSLKFPQKGE